MGLTTLPPSCADCLEIWEPQTSGTLRACPGLQWDCFTFTFIDHMIFGAYRAFSFITFFHVFRFHFLIMVYIVVCFVYFCLMLEIMYFYFYVFLLLCTFRFVYSVLILSFSVLFVCKCVLYYCHRVSIQFQLTNISYNNKYIISYQNKDPICRIYTIKLRQNISDSN